MKIFFAFIFMATLLLAHTVHSESWDRYVAIRRLKLIWSSALLLSLSSNLIKEINLNNFFSIPNKIHMRLSITITLSHFSITKQIKCCMNIIIRLFTAIQTHTHAHTLYIFGVWFISTTIGYFTSVWNSICSMCIERVRVRVSEAFTKRF